MEKIDLHWVILLKGIQTHTIVVSTHMKQNVTKIIILLSIGIFLFGIGYSLGKMERENSVTSRLQAIPFMKQSLDKPPKTVDAEDLDFSLFWDTWDVMQEKYVQRDKLDTEKMYYGAIKGMVASAEDPYTFFMTPEEHEESQNDLEGKFEGIGAQLGLKENRITIIAPLKNSPAEQAGVRTGDFIIEVDGESTQGWTLNQAVNKIRGERGTEVVLTMKRKSGEIEIPITRDEIKVPSVELSYENNDTTAYLKLNQFGDNTNREWKKAIDEIEQKWNNGKVQNMVLDLRDNPGGYLESSVYIASEFIEGGKIVVTQESTTAGNKEYKSEFGGRLQDIPLVIIINGGSASASEILSGALRDYDRATLIGTKTFGKGSVQEDISLQDNAGLRVTVAKWILPEGDWINGTGIEPDIEVENELDEENTLTKETDAQLQKALEEVGQK